MKRPIEVDTVDIGSKQPFMAGFRSLVVILPGAVGMLGNRPREQPCNYIGRQIRVRSGFPSWYVELTARAVRASQCVFGALALT